jgi:hypothetical protein
MLALRDRQQDCYKFAKVKVMQKYLKNLNSLEPDMLKSLVQQNKQLA